MKVQELRKGLIIRGVIYITMLVVLVAVYLFVDSKHEEMAKENTWLKNDITSLKTKITSLDKQRVEFAEAITIWKGFSEEKKKLEGLQIARAQDILTNIQQEFFIAEVVPTFSKPQKVEVKELETESAYVEVSQRNTLMFSSFSDENILRFVHAIQERFPGYIIITGFTMNRIEKPSRQALEQIAEGRVPALIRATLEFDWYNLKHTEAETANEEEEA